MKKNINIEPILFWDSSALIKWYFEEEGSNTVRECFKKSTFHHISSITHAEILATIHRLNKDYHINNLTLEKCRNKFLQDFYKFYVIDYNEKVRETATKIIKSVYLRGADLIQLSSAVTLKNEGLDVIFITFDIKLKNAASNLDIKIL